MDVQTPRLNWWSRNWKWAAPVIVLAGIVATAVPLVAIYFFASSFLHTMKTSGGYREALAAARSNPAAVQALGMPTKAKPPGGSGRPASPACPASLCYVAEGGAT